jgi:serine/threonine protein phosphatase 1
VVTNKKNLIAIGDIHGTAETLKLLLAAIRAEFRHEETRLIFLGDLVDRGSNSRAAVDLVCEAINDYPASQLILGNHDHFFREFLRAPCDSDELYEWMVNGGIQTLASYGFEFSNRWDWADQKRVGDEIKRVVPAHADLLESAVSHVLTEKHFFTHAGVDPNRPLTEQFWDDLMWIREGFLDFEGTLSKTIVHGHTINGTEMPEVHKHRIALDTGSFATGRISAAVFVNDDLERFVVAQIKAGGDIVRFFDAEMNEAQTL